MKIYVHSWYLGRFLEWEMFQTNAVVKTKTYILRSKFSFPERNVPNDTMWKNILQPDRPHITRCMSTAWWDSYGYRYTLRICNTCCSSTATNITRTPLDVTLVRVLPVSFPVKKKKKSWALISLSSVHPTISGDNIRKRPTISFAFHSFQLHAQSIQSLQLCN